MEWIFIYDLPSPQNYAYDLEELNILEYTYKEYYDVVKRKEFKSQINIKQHNINSDQILSLNEQQPIIY